MNERNKIEAVLFSSAKLMKVEEISQLTGISEDLVRKTLNELKTDYESRGSSITLKDEGNDTWKLTVKDHYLPIVHKLVSKTELDRPLIETLAVIAWKYPVLQADVIKIRHNKAYDHMRILEEMGFVTRTKFGRTRKITLTDKFFEYFDLPSKEAKDAFLNQIPENVKENLDKQEKEIDEAEKKIEEHAKKKAEIEDMRRKEKAKKRPVPEPSEVEEDKRPAPEPSEIDEKLEDIEEDIKELEEEEKKDPFEN
jgi:segregation and condensation protein B